MLRALDDILAERQREQADSDRRNLYREITHGLRSDAKRQAISDGLNRMACEELSYWVANVFYRPGGKYALRILLTTNKKDTP